MTAKTKQPLKLYTKTGDKGQSSTITGDRQPKNSPIFEILGTLDELNSFLGLAVVQLAEPIRTEILSIQDKLLIIGAMIAGSQKVAITTKDTLKLEQRIDFYQTNTRENWFTFFILPGGTETAARIDVARAVCRRLERRMCQFDAITPDSFPIIQAFINRLSDYLFALRCYINSQENYQEKAFQSEYIKEILK